VYTDFYIPQIFDIGTSFWIVTLEFVLWYKCDSSSWVLKLELIVNGKYWTFRMQLKVSPVNEYVRLFFMLTTFTWNKPMSNDCCNVRPYLLPIAMLTHLQAIEFIWRFDYTSRVQRNTFKVRYCCFATSIYINDSTGQLNSNHNINLF